MWQKRWRESSTTDSTIWRKPGTACALNKQDCSRIDHAKTRSCASRSRSVTDTGLPSQRRPSWPSSTTPRHSTVSGARTCLSEKLTKASDFIRIVATRLSLQQKSQSADQRRQKRTATITPGTPSRIRPVAALFLLLTGPDEPPVDTREQRNTR